MKKSSIISLLKKQQKAFCLLLFFSVILTSCKPGEIAKSSKGKNQLSEKDELKFKHTFFSASKEKILGNYELAAELYTQCIKTAPNEAAPYYELAVIYDFASNKELSLSYAKRAVDLDPQNSWYLLLYAELLKKHNQSDKAVQIYEKLIKENPNSIEYYYDLANTYLAANNLSDAIKTYDKVEEIIGINEELIVQKQRIYVASGKFEKAISETEKLIKSFPDEVRYYGMLAELYQNINQEEKAIELYSKMSELEPNNAYVLISMSDYHHKKGNVEKAFQLLGQAFASTALDIDTKVKILLSYYVATENDPKLKNEAFKLVEILVSTHPLEAKSYSIYGDFLYREKKFPEAREQFRKALEFEKDKFAIWNQVLILDADLNDFAALEKESNEAIELFPTQPALYLYNGVANMQLENNQKAIESFASGAALVVDNKPLSAQFYANLGDVYHRLKENEASDNSYEKALSYEPGNVLVLNNYSYYLSLRSEKLEKAEKMSKLANELTPGNSNFLDTYAWVLYKMSKFAEAKVWLEKAMQNENSSSATVLEHYGDILYQLNDKQKAYEYWQKAKETGKGSEFLEKKIAERHLFE